MLVHYRLILNSFGRQHIAVNLDFSDSPLTTQPLFGLLKMRSDSNTIAVRFNPLIISERKEGVCVLRGKRFEREGV